MNKKQDRYFVSLQDVAGYYSKIAQGLNNIGVPAKNGFITKHDFNYSSPHQDQFILLKLSQKIHKVTKKLAKNKYFFYLIKSFVQLVIFPLYFIQSLFKYDVFIFGARRSFLPFYLDLPILKLLGKKSVFIFSGSDHRPLYLNGLSLSETLPKIYKKICICRKDIKRIERFADVIIASPASAHFHNRTKLVNVFRLGVPIVKNIENNLTKNNKIKSIKPIILHAPSNPKAKGTSLIRESIAELKNTFDFEYIEIINQPHDVVLKSLQNCSFVIDQMYSDTPMASLATEAAWFGKPSIVGGYELEKLKEILPQEYFPPSLLIEPSKKSLKNAIIALLEDNEMCEKLGQQAQKFTHDQWTAEIMASKLVALVNNEADKSFYFNPFDRNYVYGWGINNEDRCKVIKNLIDKYGKNSLGLSNKPELEEKLLSSCNLLYK